MMKQISHVCFSTTDLAGTLAFYRDFFGSKVVHEFKNDKGVLYGAFLAIGSGFLEFFNSDSPTTPGTLFRHMCYEVDDIEEAAAHFRSKGMKPEVKRGRTDGTLNFWIEDPNGIRIEFHQYDSESVIKPAVKK